MDQAASLDRLEDFREEHRTQIGTDVSVLLSAADGTAAKKLFNDLGALAIPFEAHATIGDLHYLVAGDGNQMSVVALDISEDLVEVIEQSWARETPFRPTIST